MQTINKGSRKPRLFRELLASFVSPLQPSWTAAHGTRLNGGMLGVLTQKGQRNHGMCGYLVNPYEHPDAVAEAEAMFEDIKIPFYTGSGQYAYSYKLPWQGMQHWFKNVKGAPKKVTINGPAHMARPFWQMHDEILRWYDYWLKGIDTGIMDEPPVKYWVMGRTAIGRRRTGQFRKPSGPNTICIFGSA
jgi:hypothetical protein